MWPFFSFYGGKWRAAPRYPKPMYGRIIEPFAGSAGYSVRHSQLDVVLVEKDPLIASLWKYLIKASPEEIMSLPIVGSGESVDDLDCCDEAKHLIGFWLNKGSSCPSKSPSAWMRSGVRPKSYWGPEIKERISFQVERIKHWTVVEGDYADFPNIEATWFIDPPYQVAGNHYRHSAKLLDFKALGEWCRERYGQIIVCENDGAEWLPFEPFINIKSTGGKNGKSISREAIWTGVNKF